MDQDYLRREFAARRAAIRGERAFDTAALIAGVDPDNVERALGAILEAEACDGARADQTKRITEV